MAGKDKPRVLLIKGGSFNGVIEIESWSSYRPSPCQRLQLKRVLGKDANEELWNTYNTRSV